MITVTTEVFLVVRGLSGLAQEQPCSEIFSLAEESVWERRNSSFPSLLSDFDNLLFLGLELLSLLEMATSVYQ